MSELKAFDIVVSEEGYCEGIVKYRRAVYDKSEADKEIQRLEKLCENYRCDCDNLAIMTDTMRKAGRTLRQKMNHQKYKRCLAMAWFCHYIAAWDNEVYVHGGTSDDRLARLYWKWERRWLALADKFKEAK